MTRRRPKDVAASIRARLRNHARDHHLEFQLVLTEYAVERFLYRLGTSPYARQFVLMKDFFDIGVLATTFDFDGETLALALQATFNLRGTPLPTEEPVALSRDSLNAPERSTQWRAFIRRSRLREPVDFDHLSALLRSFLLHILTSLERASEFHASWPPGGPWQYNS